MKKISSNRSFGILFFIVFLLIAIWPIFNGETFQASAGLKKESEQKVSELILDRVNEL